MYHFEKIFMQSSYFNSMGGQIQLCGIKALGGVSGQRTFLATILYIYIYIDIDEQSIGGIKDVQDLGEG